MFNRYNKTGKLINNTAQYKEVLDRKDIKVLQQYNTFNFRNLRLVETSSFEYVYHTVQPYERLYNISQKYYDSPEYGWLICYLNQIPNELVITEGTFLKIYYPLNKLLELL